MIDPITLGDYETLARSRLSLMAYEFLAAGAADEVTLRWNREAFDRIALRPRVLADVSAIDTSITLFGETLPSPVLLAPVAYQRLFHDEGECAVARGASAAGAVYVMSTASNCTVEDVAASTNAPLWLQLYLQNDREVTRDLVQRAEAAGVRALCLTVDTPVLGTRTRQQRVRFALRPELPTPHLDATGRGRLSVVDGKREPLTWRDVEWLRSIVTVPLLLKGIMTGSDAVRALDAGAAGIIVSNHGARNLDTLPASIDALPEVVARVAGRVPLLVDGGIRRGTDVVKALARGASAVLIGRPYAYALAVNGADGVTHVLRILQQELETAMALLGRARIAELDATALW